MENCENGITIPQLIQDSCNGSRVGAGCVIDETIYSELGLSQNATQQEINQAVYLAYLNLKATTEAQDLAITLIDGSETKIEAGDNITITGSGTEGTPYVINSSGGGGSQDLQSVLNEGSEFEYDGGNSSGAIMAGSENARYTYFDHASGTESAGFEASTGRFSAQHFLNGQSSARLRLENGEVKLSRTNRSVSPIKTSTLKIDLPTNNTDFILPSKSTDGTYTLATTDQLRPYKVCAVILNQTGTDAPVATVLENTLGDALSFSYVAPGYYNVTSNLPVLTGVISPQQRTIHVNEQSEGTQLFSVDIYPSTSTNFNLGTRVVSGVESDDMFYETYLEFRVYD